MFVVATVVLAAVPVVMAATGGSDRPLDGSYKAYFDPDDGAKYSGAGKMSHLGKIDITGVFFPEVVPAPEPWPAECAPLLTMNDPDGDKGNAVWTAANGDVVNVRNLDGPDNWQLCVKADSSAEGFANYEITGGSGRFEGASGSFTGKLSTPPNLGPPPPEFFILEVEGTITY